MAEYTLQIISGVQVGKKFQVTESLVLGRATHSSICFSGPDATLVSGQHATIEIKNGRLVIRDLGSTNGTFVNGKQIEEALLEPNSIIGLGASGPKIRVLAPGGLTTTTTAFRPVTEGTKSSTTKTGTVRGRDIKSPGFPSFGPEVGAGNYTIGLGQRLANDEADHQEIHNLIKDKKRADRLVNSGMLTKRDASMIQHAAVTYSKGRKRSFVVLASVVGVALLITGVLLFQNLGYRGKLKKQENLLGNIHDLESQLAFATTESAAAPNSEIDHEKAILVSKLRAAERQLVNVRTQIRSTDLVSTYRNPLGREIHTIMEGFGKRDYIVPDIFISQVEKHIYTFTKTSTRGIMTRSFSNKPKHQSLIEMELQNARMPLAFFYLAMHESLLDSTIVSSAGARGLWQFMPQTARDYGLNVPQNWQSQPPEADPRTHPGPATRAGVKYVKTLYAEFGDVALAMAAYNAGEGRIRKALRSIDDPINNRDFWYIYRMGNLAGETNEYVPKIIATMIIDKNRARYGFSP